MYQPGVFGYQLVITVGSIITDEALNSSLQLNILVDSFLAEEVLHFAQHRAKLFYVLQRDDHRVTFFEAVNIHLRFFLQVKGLCIGDPVIVHTEVKNIFAAGIVYRESLCKPADDKEFMWNKTSLLHHELVFAEFFFGEISKDEGEFFVGKRNAGFDLGAQAVSHK